MIGPAGEACLNFLRTLGSSTKKVKKKKASVLHPPTMFSVLFCCRFSSPLTFFFISLRCQYKLLSWHYRDGIGLTSISGSSGVLIGCIPILIHSLSFMAPGPEIPILTFPLTV